MRFEYLTEPPTSIPPGRVLMHNIVAFGPNQKLGLHGFLLGWQSPDSRTKRRATAAGRDSARTSALSGALGRKRR